MPIYLPASDYELCSHRRYQEQIFCPSRPKPPAKIELAISLCDPAFAASKAAGRLTKTLRQLQIKAVPVSGSSQLSRTASAAPRVAGSRRNSRCEVSSMDTWATHVICCPRIHPLAVSKPSIDGFIRSGGAIQGCRVLRALSP